MKCIFELLNLNGNLLYHHLIFITSIVANMMESYDSNQGQCLFFLMLTHGLCNNYYSYHCQLLSHSKRLSWFLFLLFITKTICKEPPNQQSSWTNTLVNQIYKIGAWIEIVPVLEAMRIQWQNALHWTNQAEWNLLTWYWKKVLGNQHIEGLWSSCFHLDFSC